MKRLLTSVVATLALVSLTRAQGGDGEAENAIPTIPAGIDESLVFPLTLVDALVLGVQNNTSLKADAVLPFQAIEDVRAARAIFEPELFAEVTARSSESPDQIFQAAGFVQPAIRQESYRGRFGVKQLVPTGGLFDLAYSPSKFRQTSGSNRRRQFGSDFTLTYTQPLLRGAWTDYTLRDVHIQEARRAAAAHTYTRAVQSTMQSIVQSYWDLVYARENWIVVFQALELADEQLERTDRKIDVGEVAPLDRVSDEAEVARRREELVTAENDIRDREDDLRRLVFDDSDGDLWLRGLRPITEIGEIAAAEPLDWQELARTARRWRPDLRALRAEVAITEIQEMAAARDVLPQLDLVGSYTSDGVSTTFPDAFIQSQQSDFPDWSVQLLLSVPIGNSAALASRDRARLEVERARRRLYSAEIDVTLEVRDAVRQLRTLAETILRGRESQRLAESNLRREEARKEAGTSTSFEVQQRNQELQEARSRLLRNRLDYRIAEFNLRFVQGLVEADQSPDEDSDDNQK